MLIGELARRSGLSRDTLRYYERLSLLAAGGRGAANGYRHYGAESVARLRRIQRMKSIGFTLREIRQILTDDSRDGACRGLPDRMARRIAQIDQQVEMLLRFRRSLLEVQRACDGACGTEDGLPACVPVAGISRRTAAGP